MIYRLILACALMALCICSVANAEDLAVELVNNQPFDIKMPIRLPAEKIGGCDRHTSDDRPVQVGGADAYLVADVGASKTKSFKIVESEVKAKDAALVVKAAQDGIALKFAGKSLGTLAWDVVVEKVEGTPKEYVSTKRDFDKLFAAVPLKFERGATGRLFDEWSARGEKWGLEISLKVRVFHDGFLDWTAEVVNRSASTKNVYAAVICRWESSGSSKRNVNYNNEVKPLPDGGSTSFREGTERHLYVQRGVDWINTSFDGGASVVWLNDFTPSFTVHKPSTAKTPARWLGANTAQLGQEAQATDGKLYSITEIARPNIKSYRSRLDDNVLPQPGEDAVPITSRLIFNKSSTTNDRADEQFVAYVGYRKTDISDSKVTYTFGVSSTRFGTSYFPFSTLGENFITQRIPGMSKEGYWPLAAATVNEWKLFVDDVRRDLRILKAMGFQSTRLHHFELLWDVDPTTKKPFVDPAKRREYLDFFFGELKSLGLTAMLDVKLPAAEIAELVKLYREQVEGVEIDNEIILFMLPDDDVPYWKEVYEAVKKVAPDMPVHLTGHTNTGAFNRLRKLDVPFDKVGMHAYMDALEAIPSARDYTLAVADYAAEIGKEPVITEWNWRFLTRMPFEERAKIYAPIYENVLKTRSMPLIYQFQFQDSLAMNPTTLKGMRRYELLLLSRRPKPEALEFMKLINKYGAADHPNRVLDVPIQDAEVDGNGNALLIFPVTDVATDNLRLTASVETESNVKVEASSKSIMLGPKGTWPVQVKVTLDPETKPGFYHVFLRIEGPNGLLRYAWGIVRKPGAPQFEKDAPQFDFDRPLTVVYPKDCTPLELESAWTLFITLESATGRVVEIAQDDQPQAKPNDRAVIWVGTTKGAAASVKADGSDRLVVTGEKPERVAQAAMNLTLSYWKNAKDSACRRVGLVDQPSGQEGFKLDRE